MKMTKEELTYKLYEILNMGKDMGVAEYEFNDDLVMELEIEYHKLEDAIVEAWDAK